jgi:hypothetical protein
MFGNTELDEDSIKYFAKNDFYLADNLSGLEEQIYTCIKLLEKLTCKDGIASEGYRHGFETLGRYKKEFLGLTRMERPALPSQVCLLTRQSFPELRTRPRRFSRLGEPDLESKEGTQGAASPRHRSGNVSIQDRKSGNTFPPQNPPNQAPKQRRSPLERWRIIRSWGIEAKGEVNN